MTMPLLLLCLFAAPASVSATDLSNAQPDLAAVVETERRFSARAGEVGMRDSFLEFLADDVVTFGAEMSVGKDRLRSLPPAPRPLRTLLQWQPQYGGIARSGDLAWLTGPYRVTDRKGERPPVNGLYFSIWRKRGEEWKVVLDLGVRIPQRIEEADFAPAPPGVPGKTGMSEADARRQVLAAEQRLASEAEDKNAGRSICSAASSTLRVHREGEMPALGSTAACALLARNHQPVHFINAGVGVSAAGDLAYTWGTYETLAGMPDSAVQQGFYTRVWQQQGGEWKLMLDVAAPQEK
jgi:ketosteroid isomerase-like protein